MVTYRMMLKPNALHKLHCAVIGTRQKIIEHAADEFLPRCLGEVENHFLSDELVIKISLEEILQCDECT